MAAYTFLKRVTRVLCRKRGV